MMMHRLLPLIGILTLSVLAGFQNCSPAHNGGSQNSGPVPFSITSVYPYFHEKPLYYDSIQMTKIVKAGNKWQYQFVAGVVYIDNPAANIDVKIQIFDQNDDLLCLSTEVRVNHKTNHIMIEDCNSSIKASLAKIEIYTKLATQSSFPAKPTGSYTFAIE